MNNAEKERIQRFLNDPVMVRAVHDVLLKTFLEPRRIPEVNFLAASRIAIDMLTEAWKELEKYRAVEPKEQVFQSNPGV